MEVVMCEGKRLVDWAHCLQPIDERDELGQVAIGDKSGCDLEELFYAGFGTSSTSLVTDFQGVKSCQETCELVKHRTALYRSCRVEEVAKHRALDSLHDHEWPGRCFVLT